MSTQRPNPEELFENAVAAARDQSIDPQIVAAVRDRVARRLAAELDVVDVKGGESAGDQRPHVGTSGIEDGGDAMADHRIRGCEGFRSLIPAYLAGALAEPRRILFEDHTRECVPCRRALADARRGAATTSGWKTSGVKSNATRGRSSAARYAIAAGLAGLVATGAVLLSGRFGLYGPDASARVRAIDGELQALDGSAIHSIAAGDVLVRGNTVRTGSDSGAVLELADGSRVELAQRSQVTLARRSDGVVLDLERGALIVEASERKRGHLYVRTDDCLVSVVGTIFSVNHGVRGSRVSVLDGEVHVDRSGVERAVLRPGDQLATTALLGRVTLAREVAWSRNAAVYRERIAALASLGREIDATFATGGRTSTALLDRAPAGTTIWVGLPNVADELSEAWSLVEQRVAENPVLADWWAENFTGTDGDGAEAHIAEALEQLRELGSHLGEEIAVTLIVDDTGEPGEPLLMAEVVDASGFDELVDAQVARINAEADGDHVRRITNPTPGAAQTDGVLYLWHSPDGLFAASPSIARLAELAAGSGGFAGTKLHSRLADIYADGTGWLLGVDAARILSANHDGPADTPEAFDAMGLADAEHFLVESESVGGANETRATLAFAGERHGVAAWLAAPAPSGALEFVSAGATFAVAGLALAPAEMFDDMLSIARAAGSESGAEEHLDELGELEKELGFSLRDDLAAALGGDIAVAIDGPLLPKPSWKVVVEVLDPAGLEDVLARGVEAANRKAAEEGQDGVRLGEEEADGRRYLTLSSAAGAQLATMTFADGYLIVAPSRALLLEAIAHKAAGTTLTASSAFQALLPSDAETDFSGLLWQNLGGSAGPLAGLLSGALDPAAREQLEAMTQDIGPMLVLAYGDADAVRFVARGGSGPFGFSFEKLLAVAGIVGSYIEAAEEQAAPAAGPVA